MVEGQTLLEISKIRGVSYEALCHMKDRHDIQPIGKRGRALLYDPAAFKGKEAVEGDRETADLRRRYIKARTEKLEIANAKAKKELISLSAVSLIFTEVHEIAARTIKTKTNLDTEVCKALKTIKSITNKGLQSVGGGKCCAVAS
jgi:hypothetical protein